MYGPFPSVIKPPTGLDIEWLQIMMERDIDPFTIVVEYPDGSTYDVDAEETKRLLEAYGEETPDKVLDFLWNFQSIRYLVPKNRYIYFRPGKRSLVSVVRGSRTE